MALLAEAGVEVVGENRAQDLERKHAVYGDAFRWHFIGHLQSNKVKIVNGICELVHSLESESAARRLEVPALIEVNLSGEESKAGVAPEALAALPGALPAARRLMTMPPASADPEASRPSSAVCGSSPPSTVSPSSRWARARTTASRPRKARRLIRVGAVLFGPSGSAG